MDEIDRVTSAAGISRRSLLRAGGCSLAAGSLLSGGVGGVETNTASSGAAANLPSVQSTEGELDVTVATQNLGLGADFLSIARDTDDAPVPKRVGQLYADVQASEPRERMRAVADVLDEAQPDVVGLQEAAVVRRGPRSRNDPESPDADLVVVDFLDALRAALRARGTPYRTVAVATNADLEFPGRVDGEAIDVRLTDRDAILVREDADVTVEATSAHTFEESLSLPLSAERAVAIERGYARADLRVDGDRLSVVNTHLESALESVRTAQAAEFASAIETLSAPAVALGDLNDAPGGDGAYEVLTESLSDVASDVSADSEQPGTEGRAAGGAATADVTATSDGTATADVTATNDPIGGTCCRPSSLRPPDPDGLTERIDHVLADGLRATRVRRLGVETFAVDGTELWPSDHAGVFAALTTAPAPTPSETETPSETTTAGAASGETAAGTTSAGSRMSPPNPEPTASSGPANGDTAAGTATEMPGFGIGASVAALLGAVLGGTVLGRRRRDA